MLHLISLEDLQIVVLKTISWPFKRQTHKMVKYTYKPLA